MRRSFPAPRWARPFLLAAVLATVWAANAAPDSVDARLKQLENSLQDMQQQMHQKDQQIERLQQTVDALRKPAAAAASTAAPTPRPDAQQILDSLAAAARTSPDTGVTAHTAAASFHLTDISAILDVGVGGSSERGTSLEQLQAGGHDPHKRGFTLRQLELSIGGAVDPLFNLESHIVYTDNGVELEEAFATTTSMPDNLQLKLGYFLTEFGRLNATHPHTWMWIDQPIINNRLFGPDGMRGPGARLSWLTPLPWYSEVLVGVQDSDGENMASFRPPDDTGIGGRPLVDRQTTGMGDFAWLGRWVNGFDLGDSLSGQAGISGLYGANSAGPSGRTWIYGGDLLLKYSPTGSQLERPLLTWQTEAMGRDYQADAVGGAPAATLHDWGMYTQVLHTLNHDWSWGLRYEFASGSGDSFANGAPLDRNLDPTRDDRQRISPVVVYHPSEFSRLSLQVNEDDAAHLGSRRALSVWLGFEVLIGSHPAHSY